MQWKLCAS